MEMLMSPLKQRLAAGLITLSALGAGAIITYEGKVNTAYLDPVKVVTICVGHTRTAKLGQTKTDAECNALLLEDSGEAQKAVKRLVSTPVTQDQYNALVSFVFNVGAGNFASSTLLRKLNAGDCRGAAAQFDRWHYAKGKSLPGLVARRASERAVFEADCPSTP